MKITKGSKVAYSVQFLRAIDMSHSDLSQGRGIVTSIQKVGEKLQLASIDWNYPDLPDKVNVENLAIVGPNTKFCQC